MHDGDNQVSWTSIQTVIHLQMSYLSIVKDLINVIREHPSLRTKASVIPSQLEG